MKFVIVALAGCSSSPTDAVPTDQIHQFVGTSPTPLATQAVDAGSPRPTAKPTAKPKTTPKPAAKATSYYKPQGWDGYSDVNCSAFDTHAHAQSFFVGTDGTTTNDPYGLDSNHDGVACQSLP